MSCNTPGMLSLFYYIKMAMNIIFIMAPILLLVLGTIDFLGATTASDEKKMKKSIDNFVKRLIVCVVILILPLLVNTVMQVINVKSYKECFANATKENIEKLDKEYEAKKKLEEEELKQSLEKSTSEKTTSGATTREKIVNIAKNEVGVTESPKGSNNVKYNTWYYGKTVSSSTGNTYAWCAAFVSWVANETGVLETKVPKFRSVAEGVKWYKARNLYKDKSYTPKPGDIVFFTGESGRGYAHVGIVEYVDSKGKIHTIEGNVGDKVVRRTNPRNIIGYGALDL